MTKRIPQKVNKDQAQIDDFFMKKALLLAQTAASMGEVPVGAILVNENNHIISKSLNKRESLQSPIAHAEVIALHNASKLLKSWRLEDCTLYVTLEPCLMCAGTILQSRLSRLVFGASDSKAGAVSSLYQTLSDPRLNHQVSVTGGVLEEQCGLILSDFFKKLRASKKRGSK